MEGGKQPGLSMKLVCIKTLGFRSSDIRVQEEGITCKNKSVHKILGKGIGGKRRRLGESSIVQGVPLRLANHRKGERGGQAILSAQASKKEGALHYLSLFLREERNRSAVAF